MKVHLRLVAGVVFALMFCSGSALAQKKEIVFGVWGGHWGDAFRKFVAEPFEKETGIKVNFVFGNAVANMQRMAAQKNNPQMDVSVLTSELIPQGHAAELLAPIPISALPNLELKNEPGIRRAGEKDVMSAPILVIGYGLFYRTDLVPFKITSWNDLWDPRLANKVAVSSTRSGGAGFLLMINRIAGGTIDDVSPGFEKIKSLGKNLIAIEDNDARQIDMIARGETWVQAGPMGGGVQAVREGLKAEYVVPKEGAPMIAIDAVVVKNSPNPEGARRFVNFMLDKGRLKSVAEAVYAVPSNSTNRVNPEMEKLSGITPEARKRFIAFPAEQVVKNRGAWNQRWDREIVPLTRR